MITRLTAHIVWSTEYRYHILDGDIKIRCRDLLLQICDAEDVRILSGVVSKDYIYMHIEYPPKVAPISFDQTFHRSYIAPAAS